MVINRWLGSLNVFMTIGTSHHYDKKWATNFTSNFYGLIKASKTFSEKNDQSWPENNKCCAFCSAFCIIFIVIWIKVATTTAIFFGKYKWWVHVVNWFIVTLIWIYTHFILTSVHFSILLDIALNRFVLINDVCLCLNISCLWGCLDFFVINFVFKFLKHVIEFKCFLTVLLFLCSFIPWQCTSSFNRFFIFIMIESSRYGIIF